MSAGSASWRPLALPTAVAAVVTTFYVIFAAQQWQQLVVKSWDLAIFTQAMQRYSSFAPPIVSVKGDGFNLLGDHFHPLLIILAPIFAIFPSAFTLLVIQAACFGLASAIVTAGASHYLSKLSGVTLGLSFGLSWGLQYAAEAQFHEIALAVPLIAASLFALLVERWRLAAIYAAPLVFVKEDLGLTVIVIGILIAVRARRALGLWLAFWGLAWFGLATLVILPAFNPDGAWAYARNANLHETLASTAGLLDPSKGETLLLLTLAGAGVLLRSPIVLVLIPTLAWRFLSANHGYWGPTWHYSAVLMPVVFASLLDGMNRSVNDKPEWLSRYARHSPAVAATVALMLLPHLPVSSIFDKGAWEPPTRSSAAAAVIAAIPTNASVESDIGLMSYIVDEHNTFWIGNENPAQDCILIDRVVGGIPTEWGDVLRVAQLLHPGYNYRVLYAHDGYELACQSLS